VGQFAENQTMLAEAGQRYDAIAFGAHPDDLEVVMGGTAVKLVNKGLTVLFVDLCDGEPTRYGVRGERHLQAQKAAEILGVQRTTLRLRDRLIVDSVASRLQVAQLVRQYRPRMVFTTAGSGIHPDHAATTDIVVHGIFYARLPKWEEIESAECLTGTQPHEIDRLFFGHCRMELPWKRFDFAVDVTDVYGQKMAAAQAYASVFRGPQAGLLDQYDAEDRYIGSLVGVRYAEAFRSRSPLLVDSPDVFHKTRFG
jgi:LmbE family N-acetylglucosaminyl deacetylase